MKENLAVKKEHLVICEEWDRATFEIYITQSVRGVYARKVLFIRFISVILDH